MAHTMHASSYPNPFRERVTVQYTLPQATHVRAVVYDVLGREVATLVDAQQAAGWHAVAFEEKGLPGGLYLCRITAGAETRTVTLVRTP